MAAKRDWTSIVIMAVIIWFAYNKRGNIPIVNDFFETLGFKRAPDESTQPVPVPDQTAGTQDVISAMPSVAPPSAPPRRTISQQERDELMNRANEYDEDDPRRLAILNQLNEQDTRVLTPIPRIGAAASAQTTTPKPSTSQSTSQEAAAVSKRIQDLLSSLPF